MTAKRFILESLAKREIVLALFILVAGGIITVVSPAFLTFDNIKNIVAGNVVLAVLAIGMGIVLITANIDVSVGVQLAVVSIIVGELATMFREQSLLANPVTAIVLGLVLGGILGLTNGFFVAVLGLPAIIVTLGTAGILRGILQFTTAGQWVSGIPKWLTDIQVTGPLGIPYSVLILALVVAGAWFLLHRLQAGRDILAIGGNRQAALRLGVSQRRVDLGVFMIMGALAGLAGVLYIARMGSAQPGAGVGIELNAIAAAVIGGASVFGGRMSLTGTLLGVLLLGLIQNALVLARIPVYWQSLVSGLIIITAVTVTVLQDRALAKSRQRQTGLTPLADADQPALAGKEGSS